MNDKPTDPDAEDAAPLIRPRPRAERLVKNSQNIERAQVDAGSAGKITVWKGRGEPVPKFSPFGSSYGGFGLPANNKPPALNTAEFDDPFDDDLLDDDDETEK